MKIVFMGTPEFAVHTLESLYKKGYDISLVITQKDKPRGRGKKLLPTPVKVKSQELGLEIYQPEKVNCEDSLNRLKELSPDFIVVAAYGQILKKELLDIPKYGCINVHASLLPKYRGAAPINWAVINGEKETGITIMEMNAGIDSGDILLQDKVAINEEDDSETIHDKLAHLGGKLIVEALDSIKENKISKIPQDDSQASYAPMIKKDLGKINWSDTGSNIKNLTRGLKPWPYAYTLYDGMNIKIHKVSLCEKFKDGKDGEVVKVSDDGIFVNCKDSCVIIEELQFPGKNKVRVKDFLRGNAFKLGYVFEYL